MASRLAWATLSLSLVLSVGFFHTTSYGQGEPAKAKVEAPAAAPAPASATAKPDDAKKEEPKKEEPKKEEAAKPAEAPLPTIPPEVQAKLEAARRAVAEAIVAAQDAGLVDTSIDPPPILDILITGRATDGRVVKKTGGTTPFAVSPEVLGAWFTGYGKVEGINYQKDVRIINPSAGLKQWYDQRASILNSHIEAVRKAKGPAPAAKKEETKKEEPKPETKKEEPKKEEPKAEAKKEEPKPEVKKEEAKKEEPKAEAKKEEPKKN
ncbi:MAG: hypothetical protein ABS79_04885 [Planctomycetes bacterium SCN 63-9]|nr:MAG: hypothetical protein ABS79_04885 [Planctomycetes bacterium SCN 63-9]